MTTITQLRAALATQIGANTTGCDAKAQVPEKINQRTAVVQWGGATATRETGGRGVWACDLKVTIYERLTGAGTAKTEERLDAVLAWTGPESVIAAIETDITLGIAGTQCVVESIGEYQLAKIGTTKYITVEIVCSLMARG